MIAHIRFYREAKNRLSLKNSNEDSAKSINQNLVNTFFELERSSGTKRNCRRRISVDSSYEKGLNPYQYTTTKLLYKNINSNFFN